MMLIGWRGGGAAALVVAAAACGGGGAGTVSPDRWPVPARRAACYDLRYPGEGGARLPRMLVLDRGGRSGRAFWFPASRADTVWRAYYARGHWERTGRGRVEARFGDGDDEIRLSLAQQNAYAVSGYVLHRATGRTTPAEGSHVSCPAPPSPPSDERAP